MKTVIAAFVFAFALGAQDQQSELVPLGTWPVCESSPAGASAGFMCAGFVPGHESYLLLIPKSDSAVAYRYTVTGKLANGEPVVLSGVVERADNSLTQTSVALNFGGVLTVWAVKIEDLAVVSLRLRTPAL